MSLKAEYMRGTILAVSFLLVGTAVTVMILNLNLCQAGAFIYGSFYMDVLL